MATTSPNKVVEKGQITTKWGTCLTNPRISRVLHLLELFPQGLFQRDFFSLLDADRDKGIRQALRELKYNGFIISGKAVGRPINAINSKTNCAGNRPAFEGIEYGLEMKRERYVINGCPMEKLFDSLLKECQNDEERRVLDELKAEIVTRWRFNILAVDFLNELSMPPNDQLEKAVQENMSEVEKFIESSKNFELQAKFAKIKEGSNELRQLLKNGKINMQRQNIESLRSKYFTYIDYICLQLQRILLEIFIENYSRIYFMDKAQIDKAKIKIMQKMLYEIKPKIRHTTIIPEIIERLENFEGLLEIIKQSRELRAQAQRMSERNAAEINCKQNLNDPPSQRDGF